MEEYNYNINIENNKSIFDLNYHNFNTAGIKSINGIINDNKYNKYKNVNDVYNFIVKCIKNNIVNKLSSYNIDEFYDKIPFIYYTNDNMIIDYHTNIFKCVLDIDLKYDIEHIIMDKLDEIKKDKLNEIYDIIINEYIKLIKEYFNYNKELLEEKYYNYVLQFDNNNDNIEDNIYKYIYSNKNFDYNDNYYNENATNIHLYFPLIFINKYDFLFLRNKLIDIMNKLYPNYIWNKIIDKAMDHNGFRLLYTNKPLYKSIFINNTNHIIYLNKNNKTYKPNYYVINFDKSTLKLNKYSYYEHLFITSMQSPYNKSFLTIKDKYLNEYNKYINNDNDNNDNNNDDNNNNNNDNNINNNKIKNKNIKTYYKIDNITNIDITPEIDKLFNLINKNRLDNYNKWIKIIYLCHTYNFYNYIIDLSKKSDKYDNNSLNTINNIFMKKYNGNKEQCSFLASNKFEGNKKKEYTFKSLLRWIMKDNNINYNINKNKFNFEEFINLLKNNNINIELLNNEFKELNIEFNIYNFNINITINNLIKDNIDYKYEVNNEFINDKDFNNIKNYNNICLISPVGSGKTTTIKKLINYWNNKFINNIINEYPNIIYLNNYHLNKLVNSYYWNNDKNKIIKYINKHIDFKNDYNKELHNYIHLKILFITSLISLGDKFENDFSEFNIMNYNKLKCYEYNNYNNLIISLEQLYRLNNNYNIIIIDEITSFISRFLSITNNNITENYNKLLKLCKNSNNIIVCDALFREDSYLLTKKLFQCNKGINPLFSLDKIEGNNMKNNIYYYNNYKKCHNKVINNYLYDKNYNNENNIITFFNKYNIDDKINNNESILICCDSVKICKLIYDYFNNKYNKTNYFHLITKDKYDDEFVNNCNETFNNKCVIFSPKITYGIDIQINYNDIFVIYKGKSINSYLMLQQISRSRKCNNINILSLFKDNKRNIITFDLFKDLYLDNIKKINNDDVFYKLLENNKLINNIDKLLHMKNKLNRKYNNILNFIDIIIYNKYYEYITRNNKLLCLNLLSVFQGYKFNNYILKDIINNNITINKNINNDNIEFLLNESNLKENYDILNELINNNNISNDIKNDYINIKNELDKLFKNKINKNRIIKSKFLFLFKLNDLKNIFEENKNKDIINIINNTKNNLYNVYQILINLNKNFNLNNFELLNEYNKNKIIKFINNNKDNINKLYITKHKDNNKNKNKLIYKSFDKLLEVINNDKFNKKIKCVNGLYFFNQFILDCYKFIDNNLIISEKLDILINKQRYQKKLIFNNKYIDILKIFNNIKNIYKNMNIIINF